MTAATNSHMQFKIRYNNTSDIVLYCIKISFAQIYFIKFLQFFFGLKKRCTCIPRNTVTV